VPTRRHRRRQRPQDQSVDELEHLARDGAAVEREAQVVGERMPHRLRHRLFRRIPAGPARRIDLAPQQITGDIGGRLLPAPLHHPVFVPAVTRHVALQMRAHPFPAVALDKEFQEGHPFSGGRARQAQVPPLQADPPHVPERHPVVGLRLADPPAVDLDGEAFDRSAGLQRVGFRLRELLANSLVESQNGLGSPVLGRGRQGRSQTEKEQKNRSHGSTFFIGFCRREAPAALATANLVIRGEPAICFSKKIEILVSGQNAKWAGRSVDFAAGGEAAIIFPAQAPGIPKKKGIFVGLSKS